MGPLPTTESGQKYILVVGDYFSKWTEAFPLRKQEAKTVAEKLVHEVIARYGAPEKIHSDHSDQPSCSRKCASCSTWIRPVLLHITQ